MTSSARIPQKIAAFAAAITLAAFTLSAWSFYSGHQAACASRDVTLNVLRDLLLAAQLSTNTNPATSADKRVRSDTFIAAALARIDKARC